MKKSNYVRIGEIVRVSRKLKTEGVLKTALHQNSWRRWLDGRNQPRAESGDTRRRMPKYARHPFPLRLDGKRPQVKSQQVSRGGRTYTEYLFPRKVVAIMLAWSAANHGEVSDPSGNGHLSTDGKPCECYVRFAEDLAPHLPDKYRP